jgi:hypothetical protein
MLKSFTFGKIVCVVGALALPASELATEMLRPGGAKPLAIHEATEHTQEPNEVNAPLWAAAQGYTVLAATSSATIQLIYMPMSGKAP